MRTVFAVCKKVYKQFYTAKHQLHLICVDIIIYHNQTEGQLRSEFTNFIQDGRGVNHFSAMQEAESVKTISMHWTPLSKQLIICLFYNAKAKTPIASVQAYFQPHKAIINEVIIDHITSGAKLNAILITCMHGFCKNNY